jgi:hypothetical protein
MASLARIPFSSYEQKQIGSLTGWMLFFSIVHFVGGLGAGIFGILGMLVVVTQMSASAAFAVLNGLQMLMVLAIAVALLAEAVTVLMARSALSEMLSTDTHDQALLSQALARLKVFPIRKPSDSRWVSSNGLLHSTS